MKIRHHTIIVSRDEYGNYVGDCNKDWFSAEYSGMFKSHLRIDHRDGMFHVLSMIENLTLAVGEELVRAWLSGEQKIIELRKYSVPPSRRAKRKR